MIADFGRRLSNTDNMKGQFPLAVTIVALLLPCTGNLAAGESYRLETSIYVFKNGDVQSVKLPAATKAGDNGAVVVRSPASIGFDKETLSLDGADVSWSGGRNPPERFSLIKIPSIIAGIGKPVEVLSTAPVQYIEKQADGTLRVRDISQDSADAPHCRIRFTVVPQDQASEDLHVSCDLDIATVSARASVPGVSLDVGRPLLARFQEQVELAGRAGEWDGLLLQAPNGSDYSLLLLLKTTPSQEPDTHAGLADRRMTAREFDQFATYYYLHPQPELIARAIESLAPGDFLDSADRQYPYNFRKRAYTCVGFFAEVFADNQDRLAQWRKIIDQPATDGEVQYWLRKALKLSRRGATFEFESDDPSGLDEIHELGGAFFSSGNPEYLRKLIDRLKLVDDTDWKFFDAGAEDMVFLVSNAPHHPLVRQTLEAARKDVNPRTRELIDDLLNKSMDGVLQEIRDIDRGTSYSNPGDSRNDLPWRRPSPPATPIPSGHD